jgi:demethylmenaquinone methyltransferase/2-methoxy-6-polyprenyl-1,4-benzoquinol methylase
MSRTAPLGSGAMFDAIAPRYDALNRVMSFGIDRAWRRRAVEAMKLGPGARALDLATGTGDVALEILRRPGVTVEGLDPSPKMLEIAGRKAEAAGVASRFSIRTGDAQALPYPDASFDAVSIAFGIRNVPDRDRALAEMRRVTRPGGRIVILELTEPRGLLGPIARFHVHTLVPRIGAFLSGAREYRYLQESIARFPAPEVFAERMRAAGIASVVARPLTFGAVCLFLGEAP